MIDFMSEKKLRKFTDEARLISRSLTEIRQAMEDEATRVKRMHEPQVGEKPFSLTTAVNAVIVGYLRLPQDARDRIILDGSRELAGLLEREDADKEIFRHVSRVGLEADEPATRGRGLVDSRRHSVPDRNHPSVVWEVEIGGTKGAEPARGVKDGLKGDELAVGKRGRAPKGK